LASVCPFFPILGLGGVRNFFLPPDCWFKSKTRTSCYFQGRVLIHDFVCPAHFYPSLPPFPNSIGRDFLLRRKPIPLRSSRDVDRVSPCRSMLLLVLASELFFPLCLFSRLVLLPSSLVFCLILVTFPPLSRCLSNFFAGLKGEGRII